MRKLTAVLLSALCFFVGMTAGFLCAPIKQGIQIGNNSGNNTGNCGVPKHQTQEQED